MPNRPRSRASGAALARQQETRAQELAVAAFEFIAGESRRLGRFLEMTGIAIESIREASRDSDFLAGVLDHISEDEPLLLAFCRKSVSIRMRWSGHAPFSAARLGSAMHHKSKHELVIPGRREAASPESITTDWGYGFRALGLPASPRNDGVCTSNIGNMESIVYG